MRTHWGIFDTEPLPGQKIIPIDLGKGPDSFFLNMRLAKEFNFGPPLPEETPAASAAKDGKPSPPAAKKPVERKYTLGLGLSSQNVLNHVNLAPPVGVLGSPLFGQSTALASTFGTGSANRTVSADLNFRF